MTAVLKARGLGKRYRRRWALSDCTLDIPAGQVVGLVGPNGAGKTTLLHLAVGPAAADRGHDRGARRPAGGRPSAAGPGRLRRPGHAHLRALTVADHLRLGAHLNPGWDARLASDRIERPRPRPTPAGRQAVRRPAGPACADPRPGQAARAADPGRAGGQPRPAGPARVPAGPDGGRGRPGAQRRAVLAPGRRPGAGLRLPDRARRLAGADGRRGRATCWPRTTGSPGPAATRPVFPRASR